MHASKKIESRFPVDVRRNWGYWDGVAAKKRGRYPEWSRSWIYRGKHPFDKPYGEGFWDGWEGKEPTKQQIGL